MSHNGHFVFLVIVEVPQPEQTLHEKMSEMHVCRNILIDQINSIKNVCEDKDKAHVSLLWSTTQPLVKDTHISLNFLQK